MAWPRRTVVLVAVTFLTLVAVAGPAAADPPRPGDVRSTITGVSPPTAAIRATTDPVGALLRLRVARGTEVVVFGYEDEQYLRFLADGTVEENLHSPATYLNRTRFAATPVPPGATAAAAPLWRRVGAGGSYAWHDHRTHYMAPGRPPAPMAWKVPLQVNGQRVTVDGRYAGVASVAAWPWWLVAVLVAAALGVVGWKRPRFVAAGAVLGGAGVALAGAWLLRLTANGPPGWTAVGLGVVAVVAAVLSVVVREVGKGPLLAGAGLALVIAAYRRLSVLRYPVLPTSLPWWLDRLSVALALGTGVAALVVGAHLVLQPVGRAPATTTA
jgi:hypothetical protein